MTKSELIQRLAEQNPHLYLRDVEKIVETVFEEITSALSKGDRVELRGFGAFSVKHRGARTGRNPRTGETVFVEAKNLPFFKTGKALRERLNEEGTAGTQAQSPAEDGLGESTYGSGFGTGQDDSDNSGSGGSGGFGQF